ncbi:hypothetical protein T492DRAFT_1033135 [Pavlovales sp. CCMP2436]|nr:hypothetical protein T492DRAFT_1033135 [Pavlovales sp. CCMP2436]
MRTLCRKWPGSALLLVCALQPLHLRAADLIRIGTPPPAVEHAAGMAPPPWGPWGVWPPGAAPPPWTPSPGMAPPIAGPPPSAFAAEAASNAPIDDRSAAVDQLHRRSKTTPDLGERSASGLVEPERAGGFNSALLLSAAALVAVGGVLLWERRRQPETEMQLTLQ